MDSWNELGNGLNETCFSTSRMDGLMFSMSWLVASVGIFFLAVRVCGRTSRHAICCNNSISPFSFFAGNLQRTTRWPWNLHGTEGDSEISWKREDDSD